MAGAARARGLAPAPGQWRWTGEFSASTSGEHSSSRYTVRQKVSVSRAIRRDRDMDVVLKRRQGEGCAHWNTCADGSPGAAV